METFSGGYDYEFVDALHKSLECSICQLTLRDPHVVSCCGNHFCYSCINRISNNNNPCPLCNEPGFTTFLHKGVTREVNALKIYCPNKPQGCDWQGELGQVEKHLNPEDESREKGCGFVMVECKYKCGNNLQRQMIAKHETEECPKLPIEVQMAELKKKFESLAIKNLQNQAEIEAIKEENKALKEKSQAIEAEVLALKIENKQIKQQLEIHSPPASVPPFYFTVKNYSTLKKLDSSVLSPPFYSHPGGYKMELEVFPNGCGPGHKTHLSVYVRLLRGEYDDNLQWPFKGKVTINLYNHMQKNYTDSFHTEHHFEECTKKPVEKRGNPGFGWPKLCASDEATRMYCSKEVYISIRVIDVQLLN